MLTHSINCAERTPALRMMSTGITVSISSAPLDRITNALFPAMVSLMFRFCRSKNASNFKQRHGENMTGGRLPDRVLLFPYLDTDVLSFLKLQGFHVQSV